MSSIKISKKHGVNPTIPVCAWCGKEKNEVALLGYIKGDIEAPRNMILNYEPCDECKKSWSQGVAVIEVVRTPRETGHLPIAKDVYPTGRMIVVKEKVFGGKFHAGDTVFALDVDFEEMFGANL